MPPPPRRERERERERQNERDRDRRVSRDKRDGQETKRKRSNSPDSEEDREAVKKQLEQKREDDKRKEEEDKKAAEEAANRKKWTLEDDASDDEVPIPLTASLPPAPDVMLAEPPPVPPPPQDDDEPDELEKFMMTMQSQLVKETGAGMRSSSGRGGIGRGRGILGGASQSKSISAAELEFIHTQTKVQNKEKKISFSLAPKPSSLPPPLPLPVPPSPPAEATTMAPITVSTAQPEDKGREPSPPPIVEEEDDDTFHKEFLRQMQEKLTEDKVKDRMEVIEDLQKKPQEQESAKVDWEADGDKKASEMYYDEGEEWQWGREDEGPRTLARELKAVDHSKMRELGKYIPFEKNFFRMTKELREMKKSAIKQLRKENDNTRVRDPLDACPPPITRWEQAGLPDAVMEALHKANYLLPFAIQAQAISAIMSGRDVLGCASTGSGKTLSYVLPMIRHACAQPRVAQGEGPIAVVLVPTRELALQIHKEAKRFAAPVELRVTVAYGGVQIATQIAEIKRGAEIVIATPGRLIDLLLANKGRVMSLTRVTYLVFDEADRMLDMGFGPQIERLTGNIRPDRQTVMFSATFPRQVEAGAKTFLQDPIEITIGARSAAATNVTQYVEWFDDDSIKFLRLLQLLGEWHDKGSLIIVFVDTKNECDDLYQMMMNADWGVHVQPFHGGMEQFDRESGLYAFKKHDKRILVATSVAARGLDIIDVDLVVNYKCPDHYEDYVHRVGRTGRAGKRGTAFTFMTRGVDNKMAFDIARALTNSNNPVPDELQKVADDFWDKARSGLVVWQRGGYRGRGVDFKTPEGRKKREEMKKQARAMGLSDELPDSDADDDVGDADDIGSRAATRAAAARAAQMQGGKLMIGMNHKTMQHQHAVDSARSFAQALTVQNAVTLEKAERGHFTTEIEINDFPEQARRAVSGARAIDDLQSRFDVRITANGVFTKRRLVNPNERKLYLLIEGASDMAVRATKQEIERILRAEVDEMNIRGALNPEKSAFGNISQKNQSRTTQLLQGR